MQCVKPRKKISPPVLGVSGPRGYSSGPCGGSVQREAVPGRGIRRVVRVWLVRHGSLGPDRLLPESSLCQVQIAAGSRELPSRYKAQCGDVALRCREKSGPTVIRNCKP